METSTSPRSTDRELTALRRTEIGFVFQAFNLVPTLTVLENVLLPFELGGTRPDRDRLDWIHERIAELGLDRDARAPPAPALRRPAAARRDRASAGDAPAPDLRRRADRQPRLADRSRVLEMLEAATHEHDQAVVLVTHDPVAAAHADRVLFISDGAIVHDVERTDAATLSEMVLDARAAP